MGNDTAQRKGNASSRGDGSRARTVEELQLLAGARRRATSRRRRRMRGYDEPSLPFWDFVYPER